MVNNKQNDTNEISKASYLFQLWWGNVKRCFIDNLPFSSLNSRSFFFNDNVRLNFSFKTPPGYSSRNKGQEVGEIYAGIFQIVFFFPRLVILPVIHTGFDLFTRKPLKEDSIQELVGKLACVGNENAEATETEDAESDLLTSFDLLIFQCIRNYTYCKSVNSRALTADLCNVIFDSKDFRSSPLNDECSKGNCDNFESLEDRFKRLGNNEKKNIREKQVSLLIKHIENPINNGTKLMTCINMHLTQEVQNPKDQKVIIGYRTAQEVIRLEKINSYEAALKTNTAVGNTPAKEKIHDIEMCTKSAFFDAPYHFFAPHRQSEPYKNIFSKAMTNDELDTAKQELEKAKNVFSIANKR